MFKIISLYSGELLCERLAKTQSTAVSFKDGDDKDAAAPAHLGVFGRVPRLVGRTKDGEMRGAGAAHPVDKRRVRNVRVSCVCVVVHLRGSARFDAPAG